MDAFSAVFDGLANLFTTAHIDINPAEMHGLLCGQLCAGMTDTPTLIDGAQVLFDVDAWPEDISAALTALTEMSHAQINEANFAFQLLLPDEDEALLTRVVALGLWCQGFLIGFGAHCDEARTATLGDDAHQALRDLVAISQVADDELSDDETGEVDFVEVMEYVRMAALSIAMECGEQPDNPMSTVLH